MLHQIKKRLCSTKLRNEHVPPMFLPVISQFVGIWLTLEFELRFELRGLNFFNLVISHFGGTWSFLHLSWFGWTQSFFYLVEHSHFSIWWNTVISQFGGIWSFLNLYLFQLIEHPILWIPNILFVNFLSIFFSHKSSVQNTPKNANITCYIKKKKSLCNTSN